MAGCKTKKTEIMYVGQRLASKINSSSMMIVTDITKCDRLTTKKSDVTNRLNKNAIKFAAFTYSWVNRNEKIRTEPKRTETS